MCRQTTCKQAWRVVGPQIRCPLATHTHETSPPPHRINLYAHTNGGKHMRRKKNTVNIQGRSLENCSMLLGGVSVWRNGKVKVTAAPVNKDSSLETISMSREPQRRRRTTERERERKRTETKNPLLPTVRVQKGKLKPTWKRSQEDNGCLSTAVPFRGLVHLHVVQSILSLPSAPLRLPCLPRCAAVYVERQEKQLACTSAEWAEGVTVLQTLGWSFTHNRFRLFTQYFTLDPSLWSVFTLTVHNLSIYLSAVYILIYTRQYFINLLLPGPVHIFFFHLICTSFMSALLTSMHLDHFHQSVFIYVFTACHPFLVI